jgi:hypothetical protein
VEERTAFISYSHVDDVAIARLENDTRLLGWDPWCDRELTGGQRWWDGILDHIRRCDAFIFALSASSNRSEACESELAYAAALGKPILPVLVGEPVADGLLPPLLAETHYIDLRSDAREAVAAYARALSRLSPAPPLPEPLPPAPAVPVSYLADLRGRVERPDLTHDEQWGLLNELQEALTRPEQAEAARGLLRDFAKRPDLMQSVAAHANRALTAYEDDDASRPVPLPPPPPPGDPVVAGGASGARKRPAVKWVAAAGAMVLLVGGGLTAYFLTRDGGDGDARFCDSASRVDDAAERAALALTTPEESPQEIEQAFAAGQQEMAQFAESAPAQVSDAVVDYRNTFDQQIALLAEGGWTLAGAPDEYFQGLFDQDAVSTERRVDRYVSEECDVQLVDFGRFIDPSTAARNLAVVWNAAALRLPITATQADCFSDRIVAEVDGDRVLALFARNDVQPTSAETDLLVSATQACIDATTIGEYLGRLTFSGSRAINEEQATCLGGGIIEQFTFSGWVDIPAGGPASPEDLADLEEVSETCGVDPREVLPLIGG